MITPPVLLATAVGVVLGTLVALAVSAARERVRQALEKQGAQGEASRILQRASEEAENIKKAGELAGREEGFRLREAWEKDESRRRDDLERAERRAEERTDTLDRQAERLNVREGELKDHTDALVEREESNQELAALVREERAGVQHKLESLAGLSSEDAKKELIEDLEDEARAEAANSLREIKEEAQREADKEATKIVALSIQRMAADLTAETTVSVVQLPSDEMKGRIIGREGRNIRSFEQATGVDVIIDDTPEAVTVSCFDPIRRQIAVVALSQLVKDGRIHPARIEETVKKAQEEVDEEIRKEGERAIFETGVRGLGPELIKLVGRLKYRYSYGENILQHSIEVSQLAGMLAAEAKCNVEIAKAGGLLHDIGKALTHEIEGTHAEIGGDVARKYGIPREVEIAIMEHHEEDKGSVEAFLVASADAISAARPGVRKDTLENYVKRMEELEAAASDFPGIEKVFAIQAGREVRVMVKPTEVDDISAANLARDVVKNIEEKLVYPGQIKVTIIRETRNSAIAK